MEHRIERKLEEEQLLSEKMLQN